MMTRAEDRKELNEIVSRLGGPNSMDMIFPNDPRFTKMHDRKLVLRERLGEMLWQRTPAQFKASENGNREAHRKIVERAIVEGKPVPAEVRKDHNL